MQRPRARRRMLGLGLGLALALAAGPPAAAPGATRTATTVFDAFSYHGVIAPHVTVVSGYCWENSNVTPRGDAWRCFIGNQIADPCFSSSLAGGVVVCPTPWNDRGTEIRLTKPLPAPTSHAAPSVRLTPWAITTVTGAHCLLSSGAAPFVSGRRLNYFCSAHLGLWGLPRRSSEPWTILSAPPAATRLTERVALRHVWM